MKKRLKYLVYLAPLLLTGCIGSTPGGGGIDLMKILRNPIAILIIGGVALWLAFKTGGKAK